MMQWMTKHRIWIIRILAIFIVLLMLLPLITYVL